MKILDKVINLLNSIGNSAQFICLTYKNQNNEISKYFICYNFNVKNMYEKSLNEIKTIKLTVDSKLFSLAKNEIEESLKTSLQKGIGLNPNYTKIGYYEQTENKNIKIHENNLYLNGYVVAKRIIQPGEYKKVNSSEKTIIKNKIRKNLRIGKFREFKIDLNNLIDITANHKRIEIIKDFNK